MTLDLRRPEAREIICSLVQTYDVVTENFRHGFMDSINLGYDQLKEMNPRVIYAANSGFGPRGDWTTASCYDLIAQGFGGAMITQGGGPDHPPQAVRMSIGDQTGSIIFALSILAAVVARDRYGIGQRVESSLIGPQIMLQHSQYVRFMRLGQQPNIGGKKFSSPGTIFGLGALYSWYQAGDGKWFTLAIVDPTKLWIPICEVLGRIDLIDDARFADPFARVENESVLYEIFTKEFQREPREYWLEKLREAKIASGPIYSMQEVVDEEQFWLNGYLAKQQHPQFGEINVAGIPFNFSETAVSVGPPAPELGQHTEEALLGIGLDWEQISKMREIGVI
jgi:CoA:oxalate CoA-transferase